MTKASLMAVLTLSLLFLPRPSGAQQSSAQGTSTPAAAEHQHGTSPATGQQAQSEQHCDMMKQNDMTKRGDQAMGFSQEKTTHHFYLAKDGGVIDVSANDAKDTASREQIRQHLTHIAHLFADGNFDAPMFIHATTPPGVLTMTRLHEQIQYGFQQTEAGGRVRITTANAQALDAIHAFLLFQIIDHRTGDSAAVSDMAEKK